MIKQHRVRELVLAVAAFATFGSATTAFASEGDKGHYLTGDFHNHTTCSDGSLSLQKLVDKSAGTYALDWFAQVGHGGASARNCTLAEDPFEPVAPALGLSTSGTGPWPPATYPSGGQPASSGYGPNQNWQDTLPHGAADIKGDVNGNPRRMWKWQEIQEFMYPVVEQETRNRSKPIFMGLEQNVPGHEHTSAAVIDGQLPLNAIGNADAMAMFEYCFDRSDTDRSRGNITGTTTGNNWDCTVPGSSNNNLLDPTARKIIVSSGTGSGNAGHVKALEGVKWMAAYSPFSSFYVPAHLERAGAFNPNGNNGFNIEHLRDFNNAAPNIAFGFESMPGHQAEGNRGSYGTGAVGGGTYGGTGVYAAQVGGVWDALLGEGRRWFFFASSDYHNRGSFGPDQRESTADFYPGEYTRDYVAVRAPKATFTHQDVVDGLRSGNSFVANGGLIDRLGFVACKVPVRGSFDESLMTRIADAIKNNESMDDFTNCATMGQELKIGAGEDVQVIVALRDPVGSNFAPYTFDNPSLLQIGVRQPLNAPVLDHVDLIGGNVTGLIAPGSANYAGLINTPAATNASTTIKATFNSRNWRSLSEGRKLMSYRLKGVSVSQFVRLRGTNLPAATPYETDAAGNPLLDFGADMKILCKDAACPEHMERDAQGNKTSSYDVAGWADLWFYSNPVYVKVESATTTTPTTTTRPAAERLAARRR